jgi:hypothetical protein
MFCYISPGAQCQHLLCALLCIEPWMADLTVEEAIVVLDRLQRVRVSPLRETGLSDSPDKLKQVLDVM